MDFDEYITISEVGSADDRVYPEDWEIASFVHPQTGARYEAAQTADGESLAFTILREADDFTNSVWTPASDAFNADPSVENRRALAEAELTLGRFTDLITDLRWLRGIVDRAED